MKKKVIIYTMGRVGSVALRYALQNVVPEVVHTHYISNPQGEKGYGYAPEFKEIATEWPIITVVRDPMTRAVSSFFRSLDYVKYYSTSCETLVKMLTSSDALYWSTHWFEEEFKNSTGFDVYSEPFNKKKGIQVVANGRVIVLQQENKHSNSKAALEQWLGYTKLEILVKNANFQRPGSAQVRERFNKNAVFSKELLDWVYSRPYATHFYTDKQIEEFRSRWEG